MLSERVNAPTTHAPVPLATTCLNHDRTALQAFGLTRAEGLATDPQQRVLLEETQAALACGQTTTGPLYNTETGERTWRPRPLLSAECSCVMCPIRDPFAGVYVGCMYQEYPALLTEANVKLSAATATGNSMAFLVGRVAYTFGLAGEAYARMFCSVVCNAPTNPACPVAVRVQARA